MTPPAIFDLHTHVFNAGYLPIEGIVLSRTKSPRLAAKVADIIDALLETDRDKSATDADQALDAFYDQLSRVDTTPEGTDLLESNGFFAWFSRAIPEREMARIAPIVADFGPADVSESTAIAAGVSLARFAATPSSIGTRNRIELLLREAAHLAGQVETSEDPGGARTSLGGIIEFLALLVRHESRIVASFEPFWNAGGSPFSARLHHMMDMELHYLGRPPHYKDIETRISRMRDVAGGASLPLFGFVPFDPFRDGSLELVLSATANGFSGIKFYPPNGYRPIDNRPEDIVGPAGITADVVNARNIDLFRHCVEADIPVFTHCTSEGFESRPGETGRFSNPRHWRAVLERRDLGNLRLCFGHAGGQEGWFAPSSAAGNSAWAESFAYEVLELCGRFENVYADFGFFDRILDKNQWPNFQVRLRRAIERYPKFAERCCYGTDWYLIALKKNAKEYPHRFRELLNGDSDLAPHADDILRRNARRFLKLE